MAKVYVVTDNYYDYEGTSTSVVGVFDSLESAETGKLAYTQKVLDKATERNTLCGRCPFTKDYHEGGVFALDPRWKSSLKEYRKARGLCNDGVFHPPKPVTELNENQFIEISEYEMGVVADV